jgi:hypothetical protein
MGCECGKLRNKHDEIELNLQGYTDQYAQTHLERDRLYFYQYYDYFIKFADYATTQSRNCMWHSGFYFFSKVTSSILKVRDTEQIVRFERLNAINDEHKHKEILIEPEQIEGH